MAVVSLMAMVFALMWLGALPRPNWAGALGSLETMGWSGKHGRTTRSGLGARDRAELGLAWLGDGQADLGEFSVLNYDPATRTHLLSEFRLKAMTTCDDAESFQSLMGSYRRLLREQVAVTIRNCAAEELAAGKVSLLSKKIIAQINRSLGHEFLTSLKIEEFAVYESVDHGRFVLQQDEPEATR